MSVTLMDTSIKAWYHTKDIVNKIIGTEICYRFDKKTIHRKQNVKSEKPHISQLRQ